MQDSNIAAFTSPKQNVITWQRKLVLHTTSPVLFNVTKTDDFVNKYVKIPRKVSFISRISNYGESPRLWEVINIQEQLKNEEIVDIVVPKIPPPYVQTRGNNTMEELRAANVDSK